MAEIVLSPLLQVVFDRSASYFLKEITRRFGYEEEIQKLQRTLRVIQAVIEDAEEQQVTDRALRLWLTELKEVAYDADDLLDEFCPEALINGIGVSICTEQVSTLIPSLGPYAANLKNLPQLKHIRERLDALAANIFNFKLQKRADNRGLENEERRQTSSFIIESEIFGREEDKEKIVEQLLVFPRSKTSGDVSIIPIVGLGGLGKTTLAQLAYNDERVTSNFDLKLWVCVNDEFNVRKIIKMIIESATKNKCELLGLDVLQSQLQDLLCRRRYLLVLDDVWNEDHDEWDKLRTFLRSGAAGSKIIVTTRSSKVASIMGSMPPHHLEGLSDDDCWTLFKHRAFSLDEEEAFPSLLPIGKRIVQKCAGVPLAAKTLGSLMRFKREEREWLFVQESELWNACEGENGILPALRLSFSNLPPHLKRCFAYCSIIPKKYVIKKEKLIHLWIAEGLIQPSKESNTPEDIGNEYFNDLTWMFFFQDVKKSSYGDITECKMHDLIHDLAQTIAGNEFVILEDGRIPSNLAQIRHSSVVCNFGLPTIPEALYKAEKLRTLNVLFSIGDLKEAPINLFSSFRHLRVLDLSGSGIRKLHNLISSLISLRYLDLSYTLVETLPETICSLVNLQVLNLYGCYDLIELPGSFASLLKLRHLIINGCERLTQLPSHIEKLYELQTLPMYIVGNENGKSLLQLSGLRLKGELNIRRLENVKFVKEARLAHLERKSNLHSLGLSWGNEHVGLNMRNCGDSRLGQEVLECLIPHQNLKSLCIKGFPGNCFPRWMGALQLPNLIKIVLIDCKRCEHLPTLGRLPFLEILHMHAMDAVKNIGNEFYGEGAGRPFMSLKELSLSDFPHLAYWWSVDRRAEFPYLVKLTIKNCPGLMNMPCFPSLRHLELRNCNEMILRSAVTLTLLSTLVIDVFKGELVLLESLLQNNARLMSLTVSSCPDLHSISSNLGNLVFLESLTIRWCEKLLFLPQELHSLTSLESLEISDCHSLAALPESIRGLSSLRSLSIENCSNLTSIPMGLQNLTALEHLTIMYCPTLASFPTDLRYLSMLKSVFILSCPELASLPEGLKHVKTLQNLEIHSCPGLKDLPKWIENLDFLRSLTISDCHNITSLPDGLQRLNTLQHLSIRQCPALEERCKENIGEDWPKIAHVAHTYIGSLEVRQQDTASSSAR